MSRTSTTSLVGGLVVALSACATMTPAVANAGTAESVISIKNCTVKQDRTKAFSYAACTVKSLAPEGQTVSVRYSSNMKVFKPATGGTWSARTGTLTFKGGGSQLQAVKLAFNGKTPTQVRKSLKVTLSNAKGAEIGDGVAVAAS